MIQGDLFFVCVLFSIDIFVLKETSFAVGNAVVWVIFSFGYIVFFFVFGFVFVCLMNSTRFLCLLSFSYQYFQSKK